LEPDGEARESGCQVGKHTVSFNGPVVNKYIPGLPYEWEFTGNEMGGLSAEDLMLVLL